MTVAEMKPTEPVEAEPTPTPVLQEPRRNFLASLATMALAVVALGAPLASGVVMFLDPLFRRSKSGSDGDAKFTRITTLDALPLDGAPVQFAIMEDRVDAWNREPNQPVGSIFVRRLGDQAIAFNAVCPHAGCYVGYLAAKHFFRCPCHNSSFELDGAKIDVAGQANPSPRPLDTLDVQLRLPGAEKPIEAKAVAAAGSTVEVWVRFVNYQAGKAERLVKRG